MAQGVGSRPLRWSLLLGGLSSLWAGASPAGKKPNFLILFADDMGYGDMSCNGHPTIATPHLDRLAAEGMRFTQWYSGFHVCSPSRASMLTGRLPIRNGIAGPVWTGGVFGFNAVGGLPSNETTFAKLVREQGYATMALGKWHVGQQAKFLPQAHGFDEYFGLPYSVDMGYSAWDPKGNLAVPLIHNQTVIEQPVNFNTLESRYVEKARSFIHANAKADTPFLLYLAWSHVHVPDFVTPSFCNRSARGRFGDAMEEMDDHIGAVMGVLKDAGVDDNTVVFFTSDNGPWLIQQLSGGSAGLFFEGKSTTWEGGIREPGIIRWPGKVPAGVVSQEVVATYDIFPTVVALSGASLPKDRVIDGRDLTGVMLRGEKFTSRCVFHWKGTPSKGLPPRSDDPQPGLWAVRCGAYKAHFVTSCAVMQLWGDARCGGNGALSAGADTEDALAAYQTAFRACREERHADDCALAMASAPVIHETPLLYNVDHDPSEMYPISPKRAEYQTAMSEILKAKKEHEESLTPVPNQMGLGNDDSLSACCSWHTQPACMCNPENYQEPEGGICAPVFEPSGDADSLLTKLVV